MNRCTLLFLALSLAGCVSSSTVQQNAGETSITGHTNDLDRYVPLKVPIQWQVALTDRSMALATKQLRYPKTVTFSGPAQFDAYFDKQRTVSVLDVYGNAESQGDAGQTVRQGYYVVWQAFGDVRSLPGWQKPDWSLASVSISDAQY